MNSEGTETMWGTELNPKYTVSILSEVRETKPRTDTIKKKHSGNKNNLLKA